MPPSFLPSRRAALSAAWGLAWAGRSEAAGRTPDVLSVAAFPLLDEVVAAARPLWQRMHPGVEIKVVKRQYVDHHTAMTTALSTSTYLPDVMALEVSFVGRFAQGQGLEDLRGEPYGIERFRDRWVRAAYDQATGPSGAVVAAPADVGPGTMLYRADVLARAGVAEADLTRSWDSYIAAGRRIKASTGAYLVAHVQAVKDIAIRIGLKPGEGLYFDRDARVLVQSPRFVRAFEMARTIRREKLDARIGTWSSEWAEGLKRGSIVTELGGAWMVGQLNKWVAPLTTGLWRAAHFPERTFVPYGGAFYAIPRRADPARKALAWDFVRLMTLDRDRQAAAFKSHDAFPALVETHDDPFFEEPLPFLGGQKARLLWREAARAMAAAPVHKQNGFADEVVGTELDNVLDRGKDIAQALADAARLLERRARR